MTKELAEALKAVFEIIVRENPNAVRAAAVSYTHLTLPTIYSV